MNKVDLNKRKEEIENILIEISHLKVCPTKFLLQRRKKIISQVDKEYFYSLCITSGGLFFVFSNEDYLCISHLHVFLEDLQFKREIE